MFRAFSCNFSFRINSRNSFAFLPISANCGNWCFSSTLLQQSGNKFLLSATRHTSLANKMEETYLYDPNLLQQLNFHRSPAKFEPFISAANPGESWLKVRPLKDGDYDRGFLQLLSQLTEVGAVNRTQFLTRFSQMKASGDYFITVVEDTRKNLIIGAASLIIERKFIHNCAVRGRLEDVVVNDTYRGKQLGKLIVVTVSLLAQHLGCYKMSLDCKDKLIKFYESLGYVLLPGNSNSMTIRYDESHNAVQLNHTAALNDSNNSSFECSNADDIDFQTVSLDFNS